MEHGGALGDVVVLELRGFARNGLPTQTTLNRNLNVTFRRQPVLGQARSLRAWLLLLALLRYNTRGLTRESHFPVSIPGFNIPGI